jgi:hypothetical protein
MPRTAFLAGLLLIGCLIPDPDKIRGQMADAGAGGSAGTAPGTGGTGGGATAVDARPSDARLTADAGPLLPPGATADNCLDFGRAWCEKARQCSPQYQQINGGDALCADRLKLWCEIFLTGPVDTGWNMATLKTCVTSWTTLTCADWQDTTEILVGPACVVAGKRPEGASCGTFAPCASGFCTGVINGCGRCAARISAGAACTLSSECTRGLACSASMKCTSAGGVGNPCDADRPCRLSLYCKGGTCSEREAEGTPCNTYLDCRADLACNNATRRCGPAVAAMDCNSRRVDGVVD